MECRVNSFEASHNCMHAYISNKYTHKVLEDGFCFPTALKYKIPCSCFSEKQWNTVFLFCMCIPYQNVCFCFGLCNSTHSQFTPSLSSSYPFQHCELVGNTAYCSYGSQLINWVRYRSSMIGCGYIQLTVQGSLPSVVSCICSCSVSSIWQPV